MDQQTDRPIDQQMDKAFDRVACSQLKRVNKHSLEVEENSAESPRYFIYYFVYLSFFLIEQGNIERACLFF